MSRQEGVGEEWERQAARTCVLRNKAKVHFLGAVGSSGELSDVDGEEGGHE